MKWGKWSQTAASNSAVPPDGWPEGQAPSTVNDCAREMMAAIRVGLADLQYVDQGVTPTFATATTFTLAGDQTAYFGVGQRVKALGATTTYGTVIFSSFSTNTGVTLRLDAGVLDVSLSAISSGIISPVSPSVPDNIYNSRNVLDANPYLDVWQRGNGPFVFGTSAQGVCADMFRMVQNSPASINVNRATNVPTLAQAGQLLNSSIQISVSATGAMGTSAYAVLNTCVEGFDWRPLAQKPISFQFWVNSNRTGTYCVAFGNSAHDRTVVLEYAISAVSTWEKKTFLVPASPSAGTWDYSTGVGLRISLALGAGTSVQGGAGNWTATGIVATSNQINFMASAGNVIAFTGFKLNDGPFPAPLESRSYHDDVRKSRRYNPVYSGAATQNMWAGQAVNIGQAIVQASFDVNTRIAPTSISLNGAATGLVLTTDTNSFAQISSVAINSASIYGVNILGNTVGANGLSAAGHATSMAFNTTLTVAFKGPELI